MVINHAFGTISRQPAGANPKVWTFTEHRSNGQRVPYKVSVTEGISRNLLNNAYCEESHERQVTLTNVKVSPQGNFLVAAFSFSHKKEEAIRVVQSK
jgi:hypothetical protein